MLTRNAYSLIWLMIFTLLLQSSLCVGQSTSETANKPLTVPVTQPDGTTQELPVPQTPEAWSQAARSDVEAAYRILHDNHPGMFDPQNPSFPGLLDKARQNALSLVPRVGGPASYMFCIARFSATLEDGHAGCFSRLPAELDWPTGWPGFLVTWRGSGLLVHHSEEAEVPLGSKIVSCDGQAVDKLLRDRVFSFQHGLEQPGVWWSEAGGLLLDQGNPFLEPLRSCEIETADGNRRTVKLQWRPIPDSAYERKWAVTNGNRLPVGLQWREDRWVSFSGELLLDGQPTKVRFSLIPPSLKAKDFPLINTPFRWIQEYADVSLN